MPSNTALGVFSVQSAAARSGSQLVMAQATAALQGGDRGDAERLLRRFLLSHPQDAAVLGKLAEIMVQQCAVEEATMLLRRAAAAEAGEHQQLALLAHLHRYVGPQQTLTHIEDLPSHLRLSPCARAIEATCLGGLGQHDRQIRLLHELTKEAPRQVGLRKALGDALKTVGRTADAIAAVRKSVLIRPTYGEGWWTLSNFKSYRFSNADLAAMRKAVAEPITRLDALHLHFALGSALEQRGDYERAFQHFDKANALQRKNIPPSAMRITATVDLAIKAYRNEVFDRHAGAGNSSRAPIFVVGLHRSGSTLIEQILACHSLIEGVSELPVLQQIWERLARTASLRNQDPYSALAELDSDAITAIGNEHMERAQAFRRASKPFFVDKLPANWLLIGLIRLALPNATIIEARRHPIACGFSNFKQHYAGGVWFSYSLEAIGHFYRDYLRFMEHVSGLHPAAVYRVTNEKLIDDTEDEIRSMLESIGVPFEEVCVQFHQSNRAVRTPSAEQVRRPINREGMHLWHHYEPWLRPLRATLGDALERWDT